MREAAIQRAVVSPRATISRTEAAQLLATGVSAMRKYRNVPTEVDGIKFASKAEARRWSDLRNLERGGEISGLARQVPFPLEVKGVIVARYVADFVYLDKHGSQHVEDVKGAKETPLFRLKAKLFEAIYDKEIEVVR